MLYGVYTTPETSSLMKRIEYTLNFVDKMILKIKKDSNIIIGLEDTQESRMNTNTFQMLTKVLGAMEYHLYIQNIPYMVCHISSWRHAFNIKGKARAEKKANAIKKVKELFLIDAEEDAAEAILIAYYVKKTTEKNK